MRYTPNHGDLTGFILFENWLPVGTRRIREVQFFRGNGMVRARMQDGTIRETRLTEDEAEALVMTPGEAIDDAFEATLSHEAVEAKTSLQRYLEDGEQYTDFHSTNVRSIVWDRRTERLTVEYLHGKAYPYDRIEEGQAAAFAAALSKGTWVWDNLRKVDRKPDRRRRDKRGRKGL